LYQALQLCKCIVGLHVLHVAYGITYGRKCDFEKQKNSMKNNYNSGGKLVNPYNFTVCGCSAPENGPITIAKKAKQ